MFYEPAAGQAKKLREKHLVKISSSPPYLDKVIYFKGTIFQGVYKTSLHFTK
jgi:hypothetical protein